jgi:hypothetical protein
MTNTQVVVGKIGILIAFVVALWIVFVLMSSNIVVIGIERYEMHFVAGALSTLLCCSLTCAIGTFVRGTALSTTYSRIVIILTTIAVIYILYWFELQQIAIPERTFDHVDIETQTYGCIVAGILFLVFFQQKRSGVHYEFHSFCLYYPPSFSLIIGFSSLSARTR